MSSRYYVARPDHANWSGVCEVVGDDEGGYYHHANWPQRSDYRNVWTGYTFAMATHPVTGWWVPMIDPDLLMDEGL